MESPHGLRIRDANRQHLQPEILNAAAERLHSRDHHIVVRVAQRLREWSHGTEVAVATERREHYPH